MGCTPNPRPPCKLLDSAPNFANFVAMNTKQLPLLILCLLVLLIALPATGVAAAPLLAEEAATEAVNPPQWVGAALAVLSLVLAVGLGIYARRGGHY